MYRNYPVISGSYKILFKFQNTGTKFQTTSTKFQTWTVDGNLC